MGVGSLWVPSIYTSALPTEAIPSNSYSTSHFHEKADTELLMGLIAPVKFPHMRLFWPKSGIAEIGV